MGVEKAYSFIDCCRHYRLQEVLLRVLAHLDTQSLKRVACTCRWAV